MAEQSESVREQLLELLLEKVEQDTYPSSTMLDLIEELITPDDIARYGKVLMAKLASENYPSNSMIRRVTALV